MEARRKISKRDSIIEAAIEVFSQKGYHNTRMEEIAIAAGAGKGTIYEYFSSKMELFHDILLTGWRKIEEDISVDEMASRPVAEQLLHMLSGHLRYFQQNRQLTRVTICEVKTIDQELVEWALQMKEEKEKQVCSMIAAGIERGELRPDLDIDIVSRMICSLIPYFASYVVMNDLDLDSYRLADQISAVILTGIKK
jgi:TetR/AcrR family fatty acid metabolism transcriptional regulator